MPLPTSQAPAQPAARKPRGPRGATVLIVCAALVIAAAAWIAAAVQIRFEHGVAERDAIAQTENRAMMLQQYVIRTLDTAAIATRHVAELQLTEAGRRLRGAPGRPALIRGPIPENHGFLGLSIVDARGDMVASTLADPGPTRNVRDHPAFRAHLARNDGRLFVSRPAFSRVFRRNVMWLSRRIDDARGRFAGVVAINIDPAQLTAIYEESAVQKSEVAWVVGLDGIVRARRTSADTTSGEDIGGSQMMALQPRAPRGSYVAEGPYDHQSRYVSQRRVPGYPLFVAYTVRRSEILAPVAAHARLFWLGAFLVTLVAAVLAASLVGALRRRERHAAELAAAKQRLEEAQRIGRIGDWQVDDATGVTRWSPQLFEMYGRDPALGPPGVAEFHGWLEPGALERHRAMAARVRATGEAESCELEILPPDGRVRHHLLSAVPTRDEQGRIVGLHGTTQDIGESKRIEALQAEVAHLSRVDAMNAMASTLAHELNQPLAAASSYLAAGRRMILDPARERAEGADLVERAGGQVILAGEIIRRVRAMVAREPTRLAPVALDAILDDVRALLPAIDPARRVEIDCDFDPAASIVVGDRIQIQQVLMNLLRNAVQAVAGIPRPAVLVRSAPGDDGQVRISVEDNGPGFPPDGDPPFSAFASATPGGLGLGLSISRTIVESHGGRIWAGNNEAGGGRVSFTLPAPPAAAPPSAQAPRPAG
ncbi:ATP-binding protein [Sphingomonas parva]|nr:ATP-binding protein [Sphingomonas parva]